MPSNTGLTKSLLNLLPRGGPGEVSFAFETHHFVSNSAARESDDRLDDLSLAEPLQKTREGEI